ncbi:serine/threonine-protein kinase [Ideonella sp. BN130291]|uniref:serine/threonine-protein kinase n=1 Tax=Ideonella sp. BN130291 TaxID=3112940 RepID=UPI002E25BD53|nr:serine/threonine-protein kinase [Ideonella sp. BN130291]
MDSSTVEPHPGTDYQRLKALFDAVCDSGSADEARAALQRMGAAADTVEQVLDLLRHDTLHTRFGAPVAALAAGVLGSSLQPGDRCGAWTLQRELGRGGMGRVFLAERSDGHYQQRAALKLLLGWSSPQALERLARERQILASLNHPNIARLLDGGATPDGQPFLVMEYADGVPLDTHCASAGAGLAARLALFASVCEAVDYAHRHLVIHCDIKPSNVLVDAEGRVKLLDFGIAQLQGQADDADAPVAMTPRYASPEQRAGRLPGVATDVYSLGRLLDELLQPLALPPADRLELAAVIAKATREEPEQRYLSVQAFAADLQRYRLHRPVSAMVGQPLYLLRKLLRRRWPLLLAATTTVLALSIGLGVALWQRQRAEQAARESAEVTRYLSDMLASANPSNHGGNWPTVLALLERSRAELASRFATEPDTLWRLRHVLASTYRDINRPDIALPMAEQQLQLARHRYGAGDARTLESVLLVAHVQTQLQAFDKALALLEPIRAAVPEVFGDVSWQHERVMRLLAYCYGRLGRLDDADRTMTASRRLTFALFTEWSEERAMFLNSQQVLRVQQGRLREALALLKQAQQYWPHLPPGAISSVFAMRRNLIALPIRIGDYGDIEAQAQQLLADINRVLGKGNDTAEGLHAEMARYYLETGQFAKALQQRESAYQAAAAAGVQHSAVMLPLRALKLPAAALAHAEPVPELVSQAHALLAEMDAAQGQLGYRRTEAWMEIARLGLLLDDARLADHALQRLRDDTTLDLAHNRQLAARLDQLEGELARLRGDLPASAQRLRRHVGYYEALAEPVSPRAWSAQLDLAYTLLLQGDAAAGPALERAAQLRPPGMPRGVPLDQVQGYLAAWLRQGGPDTAGAQAARRALAMRMGTNAAPASTVQGSLGGALF